MAVWQPKAALGCGCRFPVVEPRCSSPGLGVTWKALAALLHAVPSFLARAGGEGHQKPFWYYGQLLAGGWSGGLILALACIGFFQSVRRRDPSPYGFLGVLCALRCRPLQPDPLQDAMAGSEFLVADLSVRRRGIPVDLAHGWRSLPALRRAIPIICILVGPWPPD